MSEWNNSSAEERLEKWREFRESLEDLSEEDLLNTVADFFAAVPIGARCIDFYTPDLDDQIKAIDRIGTIHSFEMASGRLSEEHMAVIMCLN